MYLKRLEISGFKSFAKKETLYFESPTTAVVGPNGSGKSNVAEAFQWVLGEQSMKSLRGRKGEDLIFNGSRNIHRLGRASVALTFDNSQSHFNIEFPEVTIERVVFRDGVNEYYINGSQVRLRDVIELLSNVSLGASSHHIISQNEADRILLSNAKERKQMVEDALGLRVYHWKIQESKKKLEKTKENIKEARSIRREISGHLKFLEKETEKIEKVKQFKEGLRALYSSYLSYEYTFIEKEKISILNERHVPEEELKHAEKILDSFDGEGKPSVDKKLLHEITTIEGEILSLSRKKEELTRNSGRIEGILEFKFKEKKENTHDDSIKIFSVRDIEDLTENLERLLHVSEREESLEGLKGTLFKVKKALLDFKNTFGVTKRKDKEKELASELETLSHEKKKIENEIELLLKEEGILRSRKEKLSQDIEQEKKRFQENERTYFEAKEKRAEAHVLLEALRGRENTINLRNEALFNEFLDIAFIFGEEEKEELKRAMSSSRPKGDTDNGKALTLRKDIERLKIRIEEVGPGSQDIMKEYESVKDRDEFLQREIEDLEKTEKSLYEVIKELEQKLSEEFKKGVSKINDTFQKFFEKLFGGGKASISQVTLIKPLRGEERESENVEEEREEGIEISVNLPRKKIRGLEMLSGGERALTSIALLFAMTQVKPPPFLVLDETDAALDEANSKKYGDMLEVLAKDTQLIIITHNRETMSRAGVLYGVTMGNDGVSKLLSVKFEEAIKIAK